MSVTATRRITVVLSGSVEADIIARSLDNANSPGEISVMSLAVGDNTITLPTGGTAVAGATIIPPDGNIETIILKGIIGDTGITLSPTDPTSIAFDRTAPPTDFVLNASGIIAGLRIVWT